MNTVLDLLAARDDYQEILDILTPRELVVVALLVEGEVSCYEEAGRVLGLAKRTPQMRMAAARERILARRPDLRTWAAGRSRVRGTPRPRKGRA